MSRRLCTALVLTLCILFAANGPAAASSADWSYTFSITTNHTGHFGTKPDASDGVDGYDHLAPTFYWPENTHILAASRLTTELYDEDFRAPLAPGQTKTWPVEAWFGNLGLTPPEYAVLSWMPTPGCEPPADWTITLQLTYNAGGFRYTGPTFWDLSGGQSGSVNLPWPLQQWDSYCFNYTVTAIPEPSGLLALLSGMGGALALVRRRR